MLKALLFLTTLVSAFPAMSPECEEVALGTAMELVRRIHLEKIADREAVERYKAEPQPKSDNEPSIRLKEEIEKGSEKGSRFVIERLDGKSWFSGYGRETLAVQGDPRGFIFIAGKDVAAFFGYEILSPGAMILPSAERFNWALKKLAEWLPEENIYELFYRSQGVESTEMFLGNYSETGRLPMSSNPQASPRELGAFSHDHAFHAATIYIPPEVLAYSRRQIKTVAEFEAFLAREYPELSRSTEAQELFEEFRSRFSAMVDIGTGDFMSDWNIGRTSPFVYGFLGLTAGGKSLKRTIQDMVVGSYVSPHVHHPLLDTPISFPYGSAFRAPFKEATQRFIAEKEKEPGFADEFRLHQNDFMKRVHRRKNRIEAAIRLRGQNP